jgi:GNAT superfamily N-acetyltransferase
MSARLRALDLDDANLPVGTRIEPVTSEPALDGWLDVAGACGWFETEQERRAMRMLYLELGLASSTPFRLHVALSGEAAIGMASAFYTDDAVLLTSAAVRPDRRREGIGRALALTRLREARERRCEHAVLAPSPDGAKLYETLGLEIHPQPSGRCFYLPPSPETSPTGAA